MRQTAFRCQGIKPNNLVGDNHRQKGPRETKRHCPYCWEQTSKQEATNNTLTSEVKHTEEGDFHIDYCHISPLLRSHHKKKWIIWDKVFVVAALDRNTFSSTACQSRNSVRIETTHPSGDQYSAIMMYWTEAHIFLPVIPDSVYN